MEVIVAPDVEALIVAYLNTELAARSNAARASTKVPASKPNTFVRVLRTGGPRDFVIDRAQMTLEAWARPNRPADAASLMELVRGLIGALDRFTYGGVTYQFYEPQEFSGPANRPDPDSEWERYTETFSVGVRARAA